MGFLASKRLVIGNAMNRPASQSNVENDDPSDHADVNVLHSCKQKFRTIDGICEDRPDEASTTEEVHGELHKQVEVNDHWQVE